jgi:hypothetical protein
MADKILIFKVIEFLIGFKVLIFNDYLYFLTSYTRCYTRFQNLYKLQKICPLYRGILANRSRLGNKLITEVYSFQQSL